MQYEYGNAKRGINQIGQIGFYQVFKTLGHEVTTFYYDDYLVKTEKLQTALITKAEEISPDLIFFCLYTDQFKFETLDYLKSKYRTMNWFGDDQWRFESFTLKYAPYFTYSITTDPFSLKKYKDIKCEKVFLSQWAALNIPISNQQKLPYKFDVSFVGGSNSVRRWFVAELEKQGVKVQKFGYGWPNGVLNLDQMVELFQVSRINLNLSNSNNLDIRYLTHNLKNLLIAFRSPKAASQIKARNFEIPYYGGFQLTDYVPTIENYFELGKELVCYSNVDEAVQLIKFYLENNELREKIKDLSIKKARDKHTYLNRFQEIFSSL